MLLHRPCNVNRFKIENLIQRKFISPLDVIDILGWWSEKDEWNFPPLLQQQRSSCLQRGLSHDLLIEMTKLCYACYCCISLSHKHTSDYNEARIHIQIFVVAVMIKILCPKFASKCYFNAKTEHIVLTV